MAEALIRLGLVGVGRWGRNYVRTIAGLPEVSLVCAASRNPDTRQLVSADCRVVADWRALVSADDIDGVVIASPPASHAEILAAAVRAGKAVLVEKPLAQSLADIPLIEAAARDAGAAIMVEHTHLYHPAFRALVREAKARGPLRGVRASAGNHGPVRRDVPVLWDWGAHDAAMCLHLLGRDWAVQDVKCMEAHPVAEGMAKRLRLRLLFSGQIPAEIQLSTLDDQHRWFAVDLNHETLVYQDRGRDGLKLCPRAGAGPDEPGMALDVPEVLPLTQVVMEFAAAIRGGKLMRDSLRLGIDVVELLARCEMVLQQR